MGAMRLVLASSSRTWLVKPMALAMKYGELRADSRKSSCRVWQSFHQYIKIVLAVFLATRARILRFVQAMYSSSAG
jgi:hypothetical protein